MYWSEADVTDVLPAVVTVTSTVPAAPAGAVAVTEVALTTLTWVAAVLPKFTATAPVKPVPVMVTVVPPVCELDIGEILDTTGAA